MRVKTKEFRIDFENSAIEIVILIENCWGLKDCKVTLNRGLNELRIFIQGSKDRLMEQYEAMDEDYKKEHQAPRQSIEIVGQIEEIGRVCKYICKGRLNYDKE